MLCLTDAFTKYAVMLAIDNKEAATVAKAIFENWVCKFGTPLEFVSDNGREFCNNFAKELYALLKIKHSTTTPYWPQCNSQAEVANKTIQKYLASFVDETTLDWPIYMAPMAFAYNTSVHRSIKTTPFFLTYGAEPRYPSFPNPDVQRYYGQSDAAAWYNVLQHSRQLAARHNMAATDTAEQHYNVTAQQHQFTQGQMVWLNETNYLGRNRKLAPNWTGPHLVLRTLDNGVVELLFKNRRLRVNVGRLKPVTPALPAPSTPAPPPMPSQPLQQPHPTQPPAPTLHQPQQQPAPFQEDDTFHRRLALLPTFLPPPPPPPPQQPEPQPVDQPMEPEPAAPPPPKRGPGRPRKTAIPQPPPPPPPNPTGAEAPQAGTPPPAEPPGPRTRARARALERQNLPAADAIKRIRRINLLAHTTAKASNFSPIPIYGVAEGPTFVADDFGLPKQFPQQPQPSYITKRRRFLQSLSPQQRNLLLTGDPVFAFDPLAYDIVFRGPRIPREFQQEFDYLLPSPASSTPSSQPSSATTSPRSSAPSSSPPSAPGTPPGSPRHPPQQPQPPAPRKAPTDDDAVPRRPTCANDGTSPLLPIRPAGSQGQLPDYSPSSTPRSGRAASSSSGWSLFKQKTKDVARDLLEVPPPGWHPPGRPPQPSTLRRTLQTLTDELTNPPQPWFPQPNRNTAHTRPTGARPKANR